MKAFLGLALIMEGYGLGEIAASYDLIAYILAGIITAYTLCVLGTLK